MENKIMDQYTFDLLGYQSTVERYGVDLADRLWEDYKILYLMSDGGIV